MHRTLATIADFLQHSTQRLQAVSSQPRRDAEILLSAVLECDRAHLIAYSDQAIDATAQDMFCHYLDRRLKGEPVAYILGQREFWSLMLLVDDSTLIPRPDTEVLVETALREWLHEEARVLDLGTGSGAIAIALAHERPAWCIDAVDANPEAVALALRNVELLDVPNVSVYHSDWFSAVREMTDAPDALFDLVISNPPYIAPDDPHLFSGDLRFEPLTALVAADDGYADLFRIAEQARGFLRSGGLLLLEHGYAQAAQLREKLQALGYGDIRTVDDYGGNERVTLARWGSASE